MRRAKIIVLWSLGALLLTGSAAVVFLATAGDDFYRWAMRQAIMTRMTFSCVRGQRNLNGWSTEPWEVSGVIGTSGLKKMSCSVAPPSTCISSSPGRKPPRKRAVKQYAFVCRGSACKAAQRKMKMAPMTPTPSTRNPITWPSGVGSTRP